MSFISIRNTVHFLFLIYSTSVLAQKPNLHILKEEYLFQEDKYFNQCHASTIAEIAEGKLLGSWFGGTHEGNKDVVIWGSIFDGQNWTEPTIWAEGIENDTLTYPCWNPVLFKLKNENKIYLYYNVGPNPREWWGMVKTSDDGGMTWSSANKLPDGILGPIKNKPIELTDGTVLSPSSVELSEDRWVAHVEKSADKQQSWSTFPIDHSSSFNVIQPSILAHENNKLQVLCRSKEGTVMSSWSSDQGETWTPLTKTNLINPNSATDAIRVGNHFFIVYNPDIPGKDWWEGRSKLRLAHSTDGVEWSDVLQLEDEQKGEFSYPTIFQDSNELIHITYTHNRKNIKHIVLKK